MTSRCNGDGDREYHQAMASKRPVDWAWFFAERKKLRARLDAGECVHGCGRPAEEPYTLCPQGVRNLDDDDDLDETTACRDPYGKYAGKPDRCSFCGSKASFSAANSGGMVSPEWPVWLNYCLECFEAGRDEIPEDVPVQQGMF